MRMPTLWQYAKRAGMRTVYLDAWRPVGEFHSFMNVRELQQIDEHVALRVGRPKPFVDAGVAEAINKELAKPGRALIFVEKLGSHVPYASNVPPDSTYEPKGIEALPSAANPRHKGIVRDYMRSTKNTVDDFFKMVYPALKAPGVLTIYTSDHGQALFEGGYEASHASIKNVHPGEGFVPLFIISGDEDYSKRIQAAAERSRNNATHFEIFPTLLLALGYDPSWVKDKFGQSLFDDLPSGKRTLLTGYIFGGNKSGLSEVPLPLSGPKF